MKHFFPIPRALKKFQIKENIHANGNDHVLHFLSLLIFDIIGQKIVNLPLISLLLLQLQFSLG